MFGCTTLVPAMSSSCLRAAALRAVLPVSHWMIFTATGVPRHEARYTFPKEPWPRTGPSTTSENSLALLWGGGGSSDVPASSPAVAGRSVPK